MNGTSLGFGSAQLIIQLHGAILGCIEAVRNFRDAGEHNALLNCKLQIEQHMLAKWGQRCGLANGTLDHHLPDKEDQDMAIMVLRNMLAIVSEADRLRKRYGMEYFSPESGETSVEKQKVLGGLVQRQNPSQFLTRSSVSGGTSDASAAAENNDSTQEDTVKRAKASMNFLRRYRWVVLDSKRFEEMVTHLQELNWSLYRLTKHSLPVIAPEIDILNEIPDEALELTERAATGHPTLSHAANIRRNVAVLEPVAGTSPSAVSIGRQRNLRINLDQLDLRPNPKASSQTRTTATYQSSHGLPRTVLVEWRQFESGLTQETRDKAIKRAENLARILQKKPSKAAAKNFRMLECAGYYITDQQVGFVFDLPPGINSSQRPKTLEELLFEDKRSDYVDKPPLEERLALCKALCNSIYCLHASQLVHKGIRSDNILFFEREGERSIRISEPYITGFDHSRPDGPNDPTITKAALSPDEDRYRHPAANASVSRRSTKIHDLYSLGLVLLEVAHWMTLKYLVGGKVGEAVIEFLLSEDTPIEELDHLVGSRLQRVATRCVQGDFKVDLNDTDSSAILQDIFLHEIVSEVMKCNV